MRIRRKLEGKEDKDIRKDIRQSRISRELIKSLSELVHNYYSIKAAMNIVYKGEIFTKCIRIGRKLDVIGEAEISEAERKRIFMETKLANGNPKREAYLSDIMDYYIIDILLIRLAEKGIDIYPRGLLRDYSDEDLGEE